MRVLIRSRRPAKAQLAWPGIEPAASITVVRISTDRATESVDQGGWNIEDCNLI